MLDVLEASFKLKNAESRPNHDSYAFYFSRGIELDALAEAADVPRAIYLSSGLVENPNISLGPNQRFASNGAYIVRIGADGRLTPVSDWIVP